MTAACSTKPSVQLEQAGYAVLEGLLNDAQLARARAVCGELSEAVYERYRETAPLSLQAFRDTSLETRFLELFREKPHVCPRKFLQGFHHEAFFEAIIESRLLELAIGYLGQHIGLNPTYSVRAVMPYPHYMVPYAWHQEIRRDTGFFDLLGVWVPLFDTQANGIEVVPGSHRLGPIDHRSMLVFKEIPAAWVHELESEPLHLDLKAGDAVVFHQYLIHKTAVNHSDRLRWSLDFRLQNEDQAVELGHPGIPLYAQGQLLQTGASWQSKVYQPL